MTNDTMPEEVGTRDYRPFEGHQTIHPVTRKEYIGADGRAYDTEQKALHAGAMHVLTQFVDMHVSARAGSSVIAAKLLEHADELVKLVAGPKNKHELESIAHQFCVDNGKAPERVESPKAQRLVAPEPVDEDDDDNADIYDKTYDSDEIINAFRRGAEWGAKVAVIKDPKVR